MYLPDARARLYGSLTKCKLVGKVAKSASGMISRQTAKSSSCLPTSRYSRPSTPNSPVGISNPSATCWHHHLETLGTPLPPRTKPNVVESRAVTSHDPWFPNRRPHFGEVKEGSRRKVYQPRTPLLRHEHRTRNNKTFSIRFKHTTSSPSTKSEDRSLTTTLNAKTCTLTFKMCHKATCSECRK